MVVRSPIVIKGTTVDGTGDPLLTKDATTSELGTVASLGSGFVSSTLTSGNIIVGNGSNVATSVAMSGDGTISNAGVFAIAAGVIVNADINASAAIAYSKLNLVGGIVNADVNASAAIAYSKLNLTGSILNADINASAAIARTKIASGTAYRILANNASGVLSENAAITASRAVASDSNGQLVASATTATQLGYLSTTTSDVQTQINTKIGSQQTNAIVQSPTVTQDGYAITWDNSAGEYTLTDPVTQGIPVGGSTRQFLGKNSGTNYDASWLTLQLSDVTDVTASASDVNLLAGQVTSGLTSAHLSYVIGATSNLQAQINNKLSSTLAQNAIFVGNASNVASSVAAGSEGQVLTITSGVPTWQTVVGTGTVTSINVSGGTTGLSFTGGPITTTGTITASGTLAIANGGTGLTALGTALQYLRVNAGATGLEYATLAAGTGDVVGPGSSTDNAIARFDLATGKLIQNSSLFVDDSGSLTNSGGLEFLKFVNTASAVNEFTITNAATGGTASGPLLSATGSDGDIALRFFPKGSGTIELGNFSSGYGFLNIYRGGIQCAFDPTISNTQTWWYSSTAGEFQFLGGSNSSGGSYKPFRVSGTNADTGAGTKGVHLILSGGSGFSSSDRDAGDVFISGGTGTGIGLDGNVGINTTSVANWQSAEKVMFIGNRTTDPTAAIANGIALFAKDSSDGSANSTLALYTEQAPEATGTFTQTHRLKIWVNGTEYWLSLDQV